MALTIDNEAKQFSRSPFNIGKMGAQYKTTNGLFSFPSPSLETIEKYVFFLLRNSGIEKFTPKYKYRPDYLSFDKYGTTVLWQLLLYINGVPSVEDFDIKEVVIPSVQSIIEMNKDNFPDLPTEELEEINW
jgi:hypothetical protein